MKQLEFINGSFDKTEALELINGIVALKIGYHEKKIGDASTEEDIKMRENRIRQLQADLANLRAELERSPESVKLSALVHID